MKFVDNIRNMYKSSETPEEGSSYFRSEKMVLSNIYLPTDAAYECMTELGELGQVQVIDHNVGINAFQRKYVSEIRRCEEMERILRLLTSSIERERIPMNQPEEKCRALLQSQINDLESTLQTLDNELKEINDHSEELSGTHLELTEIKHLLISARQFFDEKARYETDDLIMPLEKDSGSLVFIAGVVHREKVQSFERLLWRVCRGNMLLRQVPICELLQEPNSKELVEKNAFVIFFQGHELYERIKKICAAFHATLYPLPESASERANMAKGSEARLQDLSQIRNQTYDHMKKVLISAARKVNTWKIRVRKMKAIYCTLNMCNFDITTQYLIAKCWCPVADLNKIEAALEKGVKQSESSARFLMELIDTNEVPPTYNRSNKFTRGFQTLIDAYGVATYQEANPMPYTIITFPFLFAVMFGDAGHGLIMFLFALFLVLKEEMIISKRIKDEIFNTFFGGRYIVLLMGAFSIYTGILYNDIFAKSFNIFGTGWLLECESRNASVCFKSKLMLSPLNFTGVTYPFGIDPIWSLSQNKIPFTNSYKMKMSIVLGVMQMLFGVFFIPQVIFLCSIFGYLVATIIAKWVTNYSNMSGCAPSLLIMLINMFMFNHDAKGMACYQLSFYSAQPTLESVFVVIALISVPWMLAVKPAILFYRHKAQEKREILQNGNNYPMQTIGPVSIEVEVTPPDTSSDAIEPAAAGIPDNSLSSQGKEANGLSSNIEQQQSGHHGHANEFNFGDMMINQIIHTIEYCLGSVSHTASYLRLWALSLAHSQLSEVLWTMVFRMALNSNKYSGLILLYIIFAFWAVLTLAVLLIMEGLSAFLHALRLHWVEFQSKFYHGEGYMFTPFSLKKIIDEDDD